MFLPHTAGSGWAELCRPSTASLNALFDGCIVAGTFSGIVKNLCGDYVGGGTARRGTQIANQKLKNLNSFFALWCYAYPGRSRLYHAEWATPHR
jgi:hypothetical protein